MNRRQFAQCLGLTPAAALASRNASAAGIRVTSLELFRVNVNRRGGWLIARLGTSAGLTGIGDVSHGGRDEEKARLVRQFFEPLKGRSLYDIEWLRKLTEPEVARRGTEAAIAFSALEQCMWDIQGKAAGVPTCDLLGGRLQTRFRNYANINRSTEARDPAGFARNAGEAVKAGFDAVKLAPFDNMPKGDAARREAFTRTGIECVAAARKAIGPKADLLIDAHSYFGLERGLQLARELEPYNLFWLEEVTPPKPIENLAAINRAAKMPTAGGESIYGMKGFWPYIAGNAVDIAMPDVKYCGGLLELKKIAALAEAAGMPVAPHGPASPVGNVAAMHVCATLPNFQILEFAFGEIPWRAELIDPPEAIAKGYLELNGKPGFGISLNEKTVAKYGGRV